LDNATGIGQISCWGRANLNLDTVGTFIGSGWLRDQTSVNSNTPRSRLRELYWRYSDGPADFKIGRQMVVWGRADGINPTDNLSARDFTLLTPEDGDQRYGNEAAQFSFSSGIGNLTSLWYPRAASDTIPLMSLPNASYEVIAPRQSQWAVKWEVSDNGFDGSLSYFNGVDLVPDLQIGQMNANGTTITVSNHMAQIFGADFSIGSGDVVWRGEAAWMQTESTGRDDFTHKKPQLYLVGGGEWPHGEETTLGLQITFQHVANFQSPNSISQPVLREMAWSQAATSHQTSTTQYGLTFRLASRWWNDTLMVETNGVTTWPTGSGIWRTKLNFAINDHWNFQTGTDYYYGPKHSYFGQLDNNRLLYVQFRYGI
jgi:hypothetical protein